MLYTNKLNIPLIAAVWLARDEYDHPEEGTKTISATGLLKSVREIILTSRMKPSEVTQDISNLVASRLGTAIHNAFEAAWLSPDIGNLLQALGHPKSVAEKVNVNPLEPTKGIDVYLEKRTNKEFNGHVISGQFDFVFDGQIYDIKSTGTFSWFKDPKDYALQLSIYRWLNPELIVDEQGKILFYFKDWNKNYVHSRDGYPAQPIAEKAIKLLSLEQTEDFISDKLDLLEEHAETPEPELPECTPAELWQGKSAFKYYGKIDAKRASKSFDNEQEALNWQLSKGKGFVKEAPAVPTKCNYCNASGKCSQAQRYASQGLITLGD